MLSTSRGSLARSLRRKTSLAQAAPRRSLSLYYEYIQPAPQASIIFHHGCMPIHIGLIMAGVIKGLLRIKSHLNAIDIRSVSERTMLRPTRDRPSQLDVQAARLSLPAKFALSLPLSLCLSFLPYYSSLALERWLAGRLAGWLCPPPPYRPYRRRRRRQRRRRHAPSLLPSLPLSFSRSLFNERGGERKGEEEEEEEEEEEKSMNSRGARSSPPSPPLGRRAGEEGSSRGRRVAKQTGKTSD